MPYNIEVLSIGENSDAKISEVAQILNSVQDEFRFNLPPPTHRQDGATFFQDEYETQQVWEFLKDYRARARGNRPYLIGLVNGHLRSKQYSNLFGSHEAANGLAVITLRDHLKCADSFRPFLCYYLIRYALSFVCPELKSHMDTRDCFFDFKLNKKDLDKSLHSGAICGGCKQKLAKAFSTEARDSIASLIAAMRSQHEDSKEILHAESLKGSTQIGIIAVRQDEFDAVLERFEPRRHASGRNRYYEHVRLQGKNGREFGVAIGRCPEQARTSACYCDRSYQRFCTSLDSTCWDCGRLR
jgi:hypothetical protein